MFSIDHKQEKIAFMQRLLCGLSHLRDEILFAGAKNSAGVPKCERSFSAVADCRDPVAGDPWLIVNDRDFAADESIEESGLTNIRPSDDRDARQLCLFVHRDA
jgi:hypothetical protein